MGDVKYSLESLLAPVSCATFADDYWGCRHLAIARDDPSFYEHLFSFDDLDRLLSSLHGSNREALTVIPPVGSGMPQTSHRPGDMPMNTLYKFFKDGFTVRVVDVQDGWGPVARLTRSLERELHCKVDVNLYATGADSQGFAVHSDNEEVLVVQADGAKEWFIYDPVYELPVESHAYVQEQGGNAAISEDRLNLRERVPLAKGDFLYVPRGFPHKATTSGEPSLHLTIAIHPLYWVDVVKAAVELVSTETTGLRRALPLDLLEGGDVHEKHEATFAELLETVTQKASLATASSILRRVLVESSPFPGDGHFAALAQAEDLAPDTVLIRRPGLRCIVESDDRSATIRFSSNLLRGPRAILPCLEYIDSHDRFRVDELPRLDPKSQLVLSRRLIQEGLLQPERR